MSAKNRSAGIEHAAAPLCRQYLMDSGVDFLFGIRVNLQYVRVPGLHAAIKNYRRFKAHMITRNRLFGSMDIGCRFKTGKESPEKLLQTQCGSMRVINEDDDRPFGKPRPSGSMLDCG